MAEDIDVDRPQHLLEWVSIFRVPHRPLKIGFDCVLIKINCALVVETQLKPIFRGRCGTLETGLLSAIVSIVHSSLRCQLCKG